MPHLSPSWRGNVRRTRGRKMTTKQLKKSQSLIEESIISGDSIIAFWSYNDSLEHEKMFSAQATVTETGKDFLHAKLFSPIKEQHHIVLYPIGWVVFIPKTNNNSWNINNRFECPSPIGGGTKGGG